MCDMFQHKNDIIFTFLLLYMYLNDQSTQCVARGNILLQLLDVLHKAMKWSLLQDLTYVIPQMEPEQKEAFTSSKINLVECPHFKWFPYIKASDW